MNGVVSFTLFGDDPLYNVGAVKQARLFSEYSRVGQVHWDLRYYVGHSVPETTIHQLESMGAHIIPMLGYSEDHTSTFWRFGVFEADNDYSVYLIRDVDSRLCSREIAAINEWLSLDKPYHLMRDHPYHGVPVLAGLWGAKHEVRAEVAKVLPLVPPGDFYRQVNMATNLNFTSNDFYQVDQWWLRLKLYPLMRNRMVSHSEMTTAFEPKSVRRKFPTVRNPNEFVGKGWTAEDEERHPSHSVLVNG